MSQPTIHDLGGAAFPSGLEWGATWLDLAAMHAMQGLIVDWRTDGEERKQMLAQTSYKVADAMLAEKRRREAP